jgi:predicted phosphodiesterase
MPKHLPPIEKRKAVARFEMLAKDLSKGDASQKVANEFGVTTAAVNEWRKRYQPEPLTSSDFEYRVEPPKYSPTERIEEGERILEVVASDIHYPYQDAAGYELFLEVVTDLQPNILVLLGDIMDAYAVSAHDKDANRATPAAFKEELVYARTKLGELRDRLPNTRIIYKEGNHETRLSRYITKNAAVLSNLSVLTLPELLSLNELKIEWIPNDGRLRIGKMWHIHGNEIAGGGMSPARLKYTRMQCNFIFGHHHQRDKFRPRAYDGSQHGAYANPCLCDLEPEYAHHTHNWSLGFTIIDHDTDGTFQVEEIEIVKPSTRARIAKCNVRGRIYEVEV